eukprot:2895918-Prymnesium_polylepis.1
MAERGPPDIGGLISLKVDNFPFTTTCARSSRPTHTPPPCTTLACASPFSERAGSPCHSASKEELGEIFGKYGEVRDCYLPKDHTSGQSRGFGFIRFGS